MSEVILTFISELVQGLLLAFMPVLASMAAAWLFAQVKSAWLKFKEDHTATYWVIEGIAEIAVKAAEQAKMAGLIAEKKDYAVAVAQQYLLEKGLAINLDVIEAAIEAAVYSEFNKAKSE